MLHKLLLGAGFALTLAACASTPPAQPSPTAAAKMTTGCVPETASRLPPSNPDTCGAFGHSWSQDDISRTGQPDAGGALRQLDPTLTIKGH